MPSQGGQDPWGGRARRPGPSGPPPVAPGGAQGERRAGGDRRGDQAQEPRRAGPSLRRVPHTPGGGRDVRAGRGVAGVAPPLREKRSRNPAGTGRDTHRPRGDGKRSCVSSPSKPLRQVSSLRTGWKWHRIQPRSQALRRSARSAGPSLASLTDLYQHSRRYRQDLPHPRRQDAEAGGARTRRAHRGARALGRCAFPQRLPARLHGLVHAPQGGLRRHRALHRARIPRRDAHHLPPPRQREARRAPTPDVSGCATRAPTATRPRAARRHSASPSRRSSGPWRRTPHPRTPAASASRPGA